MADLKILGIDPGTYSSAGAVYNVTQHKVEDVFWVKNEDFVLRASSAISTAKNLIVSYERFQHYNTKEGVGNSTFRTCCWYGRFIEGFYNLYGINLKIHSITSPDVKLAFLGLSNPRDAKLLVKRAIGEMFSQTGGGSTPAIGVKNKPGPLFIMRSQPVHCWDAVAVCLVTNMWLNKRFTGDIETEVPCNI
jgi:hypothetical protein